MKKLLDSLIHPRLYYRL